MSEAGESVPLRQHVDALFEQNQMALALAAVEREKAARALREALSQRIESGDKQLEAHVNAQIESVKLALAAAQQLSAQERDSAEKAVDKAFTASKELADKHNDLLAKGERDRDLFATKVDLGYFRERIDEGTAARELLLPREVYDRSVVEWTDWRNRVNDGLNDKIGRKEYDKAEDEWSEWRTIIDSRLQAFAATLSQQEAVNSSLTEYQRERKDNAGVTLGQVVAVVTVVLTVAAILVGAFT